MTTNIQLLRSSIAYKRPSAAPLLEGQAAINYNAAEPGLFFRLTDGRLGKVGPMAITDNGLEPNAAPAGEVGNSTGEEWLDSRVTLYSPVGHVYDGNQFVTTNGFKVDKNTGDFTLMRELTIQKLNTNELFVDGPAVIGGNITPNGQNCAYFLGNINERWDYAYLCNLDVTTDGLIGNDLTVLRDVTIGRDMSVARHVTSNLIPDLPATRFLGNSSNPWAGTHTTDLWTYGNTFIGSSCLASTLTVNATATFKCEVTFQEPLKIGQIGTSCSEALTMLTTTTFKCPTTFEQYITVPQIGTACGEALSIRSTPTFRCETTFEKPIKVPQIGTNCSETLNVLALSTFKCGVTFEQPIKIDQIGSSCTDTLTIFATTTVKCPITFEQPIHIDQIGTTCSEALTINATTTFKCPVIFEGAITLPPSAIPDPIFKGTIILGDGCATSTINLNGAVTQSCDIVPAGNNAQSIGTAGKRLKNLFSTVVNASTFTGGTFSGSSLSLTAKGTSAITVDSDPDNTMVTKKWILDKIPTVTAHPWTKTGTTVKPTTANDNVMPNGTNGTIGTSGTKWKAVYASDVYTGDLHLKNDKGDWTMIEAEDYLTIRNNKTGKTFKLLMEEV